MSRPTTVIRQFMRPVSPVAREVLRRLNETHGLRALADMACSSTTTLGKVLDGMPITPGSAEALEAFAQSQTALLNLRAETA